MLVDRAGQVRLLEHLEHVLGLQHRELRRRARDERMRRLRRAVDDLLELLLFAFPAFHFLLKIHRQAELLAQLQIVRLPVAAPGRQVVRAHANQRLARIGLRRTELALRILLEQQRPVGKHAGLVQRGAQFGRARCRGPRRPPGSARGGFPPPAPRAARGTGSSRSRRAPASRPAESTTGARAPSRGPCAAPRPPACWRAADR